MKKFVLSTFLSVLTLFATSLQAGKDDQFPPLSSEHQKSYSQVVHPTNPEEILADNDAAKKEFEERQQHNIKLLQSNLETCKDNERDAQALIEQSEEGLSLFKTLSQNSKYISTEASLMKATILFEQIERNVKDLLDLTGVYKKRDELQIQIESTQAALSKISPPTVIEDSSNSPSITPQGPSEQQPKLTKRQRRAQRNAQQK